MSHLRAIAGGPAFVLRNPEPTPRKQRDEDARRERTLREHAALDAEHDERDRKDEDQW